MAPDAVVAKGAARELVMRVSVESIFERCWLVFGSYGEESGTDKVD